MAMFLVSERDSRTLNIDVRAENDDDDDDIALPEDDQDSEDDLHDSSITNLDAETIETSRGPKTLGGTAPSVSNVDFPHQVTDDFERMRTDRIPSDTEVSQTVSLKRHTDNDSVQHGTARNKKRKVRTIGYSSSSEDEERIDITNSYRRKSRTRNNGASNSAPPSSLRFVMFANPDWVQTSLRNSTVFVLGDKFSLLERVEGKRMVLTSPKLRIREAKEIE